MKGILAYDTDWKVIYPKNILSNKVFQTGELRLHPSLPHGAVLIEGAEVDFDVVDEFTHPELFTNKAWGEGVNYAKLTRVYFK